MSDETTNETASKSSKPPYIAYAVIDRGKDNKKSKWGRSASPIRTRTATASHSSCRAALQRPHHAPGSRQEIMHQPGGRKPAPNRKETIHVKYPLLSCRRRRLFAYLAALRIPSGCDPDFDNDMQEIERQLAEIRMAYNRN